MTERDIKQNYCCSQGATPGSSSSRGHTHAGEGKSSIIQIDEETKEDNKELVAGSREQAAGREAVTAAALGGLVPPPTWCE